MALKNIIWWILFIIFALLMQNNFAHLDILIIGFIILLQEDDLKQILYIAPVLYLLQESLSSFAFGTTLLWYMAAFVLIVLSRWLFEVENFLFMFLFSSALAVARIGIYMLFARLQNLEYFSSELMDTSVVQALVMPIIWWFFSLLRPKKVDAVIV